MSIEQFGESLLTKQRDRIKKQERRARRADLLGTAATIGIGVYRNNLKKKQEEFFKSAPVMNEKIVYATADTAADQAFAEDAKISSHTGPRDNYYSEGFIPQIKNALLEQNPDLKLAIDKGAYDPMIRNKANEFSKIRVAAQDKRLEAARLHRRSGSFKDSLELVNKRPESPAQGFFSMFRGKSREDLEQETVTAYRESAAARGASNLNDFDDAYGETRDLLTAIEFSQDEKTLDHKEQKPFMKIEHSITSRTITRDGQEVEQLQVKKKTTNRLEDTVKEEIVETKDLLSSEELEKNKDQAALKTLNKEMNIYKEAKSALNSEVFKEKWEKTAREKLIAAGVRPEVVIKELYQPSTLANWDILAKTFNEFSFSNEDFNAALDEKHVEAIASNLSKAQFYMVGINQHYQTLVTAKESGAADEKFIQGWQVELEKLIYDNFNMGTYAYRRNQ